MLAAAKAVPLAGGHASQGREGEYQLCAQPMGQFYQTPPHVDLGIAFGREFEAGRISDESAPSLLRAWSSDRGWTPRQAAKAAVILDKAGRPVPPSTHTRGDPWWFDTRPERQALRGRKSGIMRRWRERERDELIDRWYHRGIHTVAEMAEHFGLTRQAIYHVLHRVVSAPLPRLAAIVKRTIENVPVLGIPSAVRGREPRIWTSLMRWCGLRTVREQPDDAVEAEAERLNALEERPLKPRRLAAVVARVCRERRTFA